MDKNEQIIEVNIDEEMKRSFLDYSMSVIVSRALPDARDGLKPVHRRILYTLFENNLTSDKPYRKCADTVGSVLGRYHPHGDASVYDALVRMAQSFSMRYALIDGHGNFGSVDGDPPAAYRYTEARMSKISSEILKNIDKETVDFASNYDDRLEEPTVLPSRFPNLLANGSSGIAVGMATNIPPHNLGEIIDATCHLIDNPDADIDEIMKFIKGPDFPTGGIIIGNEEIKKAYKTGRGKITVKAKVEIEEGENSKNRIIVTELPYQVNKARLVESIANLIKDKKIESITRIEDHSDREGMRIEINVKSSSSMKLVLNQLYSYSQLQVTFGVIMLAIVNGEPKILNIKESLQIYINFQVEIITRRTNFDLKKSLARVHILNGLKIAIDNIDKVISILRSSSTVAEGKAGLTEEFDLSKEQTEAIVQMALGKLTNLEINKLEDEIKLLNEKISYFNSILSDRNKLLSILKDEVLEIKKHFSDKRRTEIVYQEDKTNIEDLIPHCEKVVIFTNMGYIKTQNIDLYHAQKRGGRGVSGLTRREDDSANEIITADSHDFILFFSNLGKVYKLKCYEIPEGSKVSKGLNIINLLSLVKDEKITSFLKVSKFESNSYLVMVTKFGYIKKTSLDLFEAVRKNGIAAINLESGDELVWTKITNGSRKLLITTRKGKSIRFNESELRPLGRSTRGVRAIRLAKGDYIINMITAENSDMILTVSETGYGRISKGSDFRLQGRGGSGIINYHSKNYGNVAATVNVKLNDDLIIIASNGIIIRIKANSVKQCSRPSKGVKIMKLNKKDKIVSVINTENI
ncbi:MAG: DNA gyrase subunit A [Candidatus Improbicoccus pseudotrichonymphae]|uniref:DNA gyrase subunit A n=1 Tax=Candidatus Improbicoccus pseudotrichonymphae TaxID=3033792 RepID=A0AA48HVA2_9FIRM|nr:MAG: DNA gyrase subunit A [Candidatus Improbicoccus pseudotrichonymphae]